jgi:hypothetical protein
MNLYEDPFAPHCRPERYSDPLTGQTQIGLQAIHSYNMTKAQFLNYVLSAG